MAGPLSEGGLDNLELGLAEYAEEEAERTLKAYALNHKTHKHYLIINYSWKYIIINR